MTKYLTFFYLLHYTPQIRSLFSCKDMATNATEARSERQDTKFRYTYKGRNFSTSGVLYTVGVFNKDINPLAQYTVYKAVSNKDNPVAQYTLYQSS